MRKLILVFVLLFFSTMLYGCESSIEIVNTTLISYPSRIVYIAGLDYQLDLSGGIIEVTLKNGEKINTPMDSNIITCYYDIDFSKTGIYIIKVGKEIQFPIQVVDEDYITNLINDTN